MKPTLSRHAHSIWLAVLILTLGGAVAIYRMPVSLFPYISYPRVVVAVEAGDRDAAQMAAEITRPMEIALRAVPGVTRIRSTTSRGSAQVALNFSWGEDMVAATLATQGALAAVQNELPAGTRTEVRRSDPSLFPVIGLALTSDNLDQEALRQLAELKLRPALTAVQGVAGVDVLGGSPREFAVELDPASLLGFGLGPDNVVKALADANSMLGVGRIEDRHRLYLILVQNPVTDIRDLTAIPLKSSGAGVITLGQVATITPSAEPVYTKVNSNGSDAVLVNIRQALNGDSVAIVKAVDLRLQQLGLPPSVHVAVYYDQSELVTGAANAVRDAILLGALLAGMILYLFFRSPRLMLITGLMLPAVLAGACLVLYALGFSFNMMTLGGMAAAVGLIIDDAVVMLEHVMRRMQEGVAAGTKGVLQAAAEMSKPLWGSTTATIIVFLPLSFISGVSGGFFQALAVTMVAALGISLLYARFALPLIASRWLGKRDAEAAERAGAVMSVLSRGYTRISSSTLRHPALLVTGVVVVMVASGFYAWQRVPSGFMPAMDEGGFVLDYKAQSGAALEDTDRLLRQVEQIITTTPEVSSYSRRTGVQLGGGLTEADEGDYFIRLKGGSRRPIEAVMSDVRQQIARDVPGLEVELIQLMEDLIGDLTAVPQPIEVKLFSNDPAELESSARLVGQTLEGIPGVVEVVDGLRVAGDAISITLDRGLAAQQGFDPAQVASQLQTLIGGSVATQVRVGEQLVAVRVRGSEDIRSYLDQMQHLPLIAPDGHLVNLGQIATVSIDPGQKQQTREDLAPFVAVTARLEGRDLGSAMKEVQARVRTLALPASVRVDYGGLYQQQQQSFTDMSMVFAAALLLSALLLAFLFERLSWALAVILTVLLSATAVLLGLWLTSIELNISAMMGLTMVVGMVSELSIFYLSEIETDGSLDVVTLGRAGLKRLRPILMSALIAILTLSPLALGVSRGAGLQQPLATAIIFGLVAAVPLILFFLPALLILNERHDEPA
ncbi:MAG: efflux RND transporter permease subunit [Pseudomonadales bacterium]|nr:efflux RND transporter permease subunit [Pseudomonadales bacterium]